MATILFLESSFIDWSIHHILYNIPLYTINKTQPNNAKYVKYFIILHSIDTICLAHFSTLQSYKLGTDCHSLAQLSYLTSSHTTHGIFSVTLTFTVPLSQAKLYSI